MGGHTLTDWLVLVFDVLFYKLHWNNQLCLWWSIFLSHYIIKERLWKKLGIGMSSKIHSLGRSAKNYRAPQMHWYSIPYLLSAKLVLKQTPMIWPFFFFFLSVSSFGNSNTTVSKGKANRLLQPVPADHRVTADTRWEMTLQPLQKQSLLCKGRLGWQKPVFDFSDLIS